MGDGQEVFAVQVGAYADSSAARRVTDSLSMAGWQAYVSRGDTGALFRVRVSPSQTEQLTERVAFALRSDSVDAVAVVDTAPVEPQVEVLAVNKGSQGMASRVRWLLSPNGRALIVVHDPAAVEAEPVPDGFIYASEGDGYVYQRDSVWDVAPSPAWNRIAFGQAFIIRNPEAPADTGAVDPWSVVAEHSGMPVDSVRANAFPVSGMSTTLGYSRPMLLQLDAVDSISGQVQPLEAPVYLSGGWRVRWLRDSTLLAIGDAPARAQDDSPPRNWNTIALATAEVQGTTSQSRLVPLDWRLGPTLDISVAIDLQSTRPLRVEGASITSAAGWIRRDGKVVGPGVALAATRDGRFIAALAPRPNAQVYEAPLEPVVYRVR
jgi:hypothetical protein